MEKMTESKLAEMLYQDAIADASLEAEGAQWDLVGSQIFLTLGRFNETGQRIHPQRFIITIDEE